MDTQNQADPQLEGAGQGTPDSDDEDQYFVRIDTRKWAEELSRLEKEDKGFGNVLHSRIGSRAAETHLPRIRQMELDLEEARREAKRNRMLSMSREEVEQQYANDQQFAKDWTELVVHNNPDEIEARREFLRAQQRVESILTRAGNRGLPEEVLNGIKKDMSEGRFDKDESGRPIQWHEGGFDLFQDAVNDAILDHVTRRSQNEDEEDSSAPPIRRSQVEAPQGNPVLTRGGPDNSASSGGRIGKKPVYKTWQEAATLFGEGKISSDEYQSAKERLPYSLER